MSKDFKVSVTKKQYLFQSRQDCIHLLSTSCLSLTHTTLVIISIFFIFPRSTLFFNIFFFLKYFSSSLRSPSLLLSQGPLKPHVPASHLTNSAASPGPGAYNSSSTFGRMSQSKNQSNPNAKFGTSKREDSSKTYISQKHQKSMPSSYSQESYYGDLEKATSMGRQASSSKRTSANVGFGKANRFNKINKNSTSNVDYGKVNTSPIIHDIFISL